MWNVISFILIFSWETSATTLAGKVSKWQWPEIKRSRVIKVMIPKNSPIIRMKNRKMFTLPQDIYARSYQLSDGQGYRYLFGKNKKVQYKIQERYIINVEAITNLKQEPYLYDPLLP